ncbi:hypothetical protein [Noviherbaspirillum aerium]|uniref:hypothetical protein n=1 Tax=Noviherbaspirillum aerium TaxID=2588497 RepID=UPI00124C48CB|nr:hypothetical protein [Noviherbaspirillum aerium]
MPKVLMECTGCNREFEIVEISCSFVDEDMTDTVECPACGKAMQGRPGKIYVSDPVIAGLSLSSQKRPDSW